MTAITLEGFVRGAEVIDVYDDPRVLVRVGDWWPGDDAIVKAAADAWMSEVDHEDVPAGWTVGTCRRYRWRPCGPGADYTRFLEPVDALERGSFWGVIVTPGKGRP